MTAPLAGVRVVEVANWMAAPGAAALMADMGADVVKVEPLRGDAMRGATRQPQVPDGQDPVDAAAYDIAFTLSRFAAWANRSPIARRGSRTAR